ncbi:hypothetical protein BGP_4870 [Beggiatoa sp. PS]|nr:hypothetical protein BGP_4870 [Beggiatoa sp. PS]
MPYSLFPFPISIHQRFVGPIHKQSLMLVHHSLSLFLLTREAIDIEAKGLIILTCPPTFIIDLFNNTGY